MGGVRAAAAHGAAFVDLDRRWRVLWGRRWVAVVAVGCVRVCVRVVGVGGCPLIRPNHAPRRVSGP